MNNRIFEAQGVKYCQSYQSIIAKVDASGQVYLDGKTWNYSKTTAKHRSKFLGERTAETQAKIKSGVYCLINLN